MGMDQHHPISSKIGVNQQVSGSKLSLRANSGTILLISASGVASFDELETYPSMSGQSIVTTTDKSNIICHLL
jgi:hypothetical protein